MHAVNNSLAVIFDSALVEDRVSLLLGVAATIGEPEDRILQSTHFFFDGCMTVPRLNHC